MRRLGRAGLEFARRSRVSRNRRGGSQRSGLGRADRSDVALPLSADCAEAGYSSLSISGCWLSVRDERKLVPPKPFTAMACRKSGKRERARRQSPSLSRIQTNVRVATTRGGVVLPDDLDRKQGSDQSPPSPLLLHKKERRD